MNGSLRNCSFAERPLHESAPSCAVAVRGSRDNSFNDFQGLTGCLKNGVVYTDSLSIVSEATPIETSVD